jgi:hypothetical protein
MQAMKEWKIWTISERLSDSYAKYYRSTEHVTFEITVYSSKVESYSNIIYKRTTDLAQKLQAVCF